MQTLKIGIIGTGFITKFLVEAAKQVRNIEISALLNRSGASRLSSYIQQNNLGNAKLCDSIEDVCAHSNAVAIFSPNYTRLEAMEKIAEFVQSGGNLMGVICEKPLGRTVSESRTMVKLARESRLNTAYLENQLHMNAVNNALYQLKPQLESVGNFVLSRSTEEHGGPHSSWFWDPRLQGGGVLSDMGCHSIAVCKYILTPPGKKLDFLEAVSVQCDTSLLKWGQPKYREVLKQKFDIDYAKIPAEDFATGVITFRNPETSQLVKAQFTNSWMYDKQGLKISMEGLGPGFAMEVNTLLSPAQIFIGDEASSGTADAELALEKSTSSKGLIFVQPNEAHLYGYVTELQDVANSFLNHKDAMLNWEYGLEISRLVQAAYLSAELKSTIDLSDEKTLETLENYTSLIAQGKGADLLHS